MKPEQTEANFKAFSRHILFWWPDTKDEEIREAYERLYCRVAARMKRNRKRAWSRTDTCPPEEPQRREDLRPIQVIMRPVIEARRQPQPLVKRGHEPLDIKA